MTACSPERLSSSSTTRAARSSWILCAVADRLPWSLSTAGPERQRREGATARRAKEAPARGCAPALEYGPLRTARPRQRPGPVCGGMPTGPRGHRCQAPRRALRRGRADAVVQDSRTPNTAKRASVTSSSRGRSARAVTVLAMVLIRLLRAVGATRAAEKVDHWMQARGGR
jgi:hypothetical protein